MSSITAPTPHGRAYVGMPLYYHVCPGQWWGFLVICLPCKVLISKCCMMSFDALGKTRLTWLQEPLADGSVLSIYLVDMIWPILITPGFQVLTKRSHDYPTMHSFSVAFSFNFLQPLSVRKKGHMTSIHSVGSAFCPFQNGHTGLQL